MDNALSVRNDIYAASAQMPRYQCHKKVWALKVAAVDMTPEGWRMSFVLGHTYAPVVMSGEWFNRQIKVAPEGDLAGGYYVVYEDGYSSWSPAKAFEEGYTALP